MLRAVIYCRCSTEEESQKEALKKQVLEAEESVRENGWLLVDEYIESKSGTTAQNRKEYQRLFEELQRDKFDIILIKSQDRLMRNTKDWYLFVDRLVNCEKKLYMYMERRFYTPDDALITGIKAILAEEYSKELSKKINNAHRNRQRRGESFIIPPETYGYRKLPDKSIVIVEEEAEVVRHMFRLACTMGCQRVAKTLAKAGYCDRNGKYFSEETIRRVIRNPIRCGTVIQNKRHFDFQRKQEYKMPPNEWIVHKHAVPAIVSEVLWKEANRAMDQRAGQYRGTPPPARVQAGKYPLSGRIHCGLCKDTYYRTCRSRPGNGTKIVEWKCRRYLRWGRDKESEGDCKGCANMHLKEDTLLAFLETVCQVNGHNGSVDRQMILEKARIVLRKVMEEGHKSQKSIQLRHTIEKQEQIRQRLLDKLLNNIITDEDYRVKNKQLEEKLEALHEKLEICIHTEKRGLHTKNRMRQLEKRLEDDLIQQAIHKKMMEQIQDIFVYPERLRIQFTEKEKSIIKEYHYSAKNETKLEQIIGYMRDNPLITAKVIAKAENIGISAVNYRIKRLKQQGRIYYNGNGGRGKWVVVEKMEG